MAPSHLTLNDLEMSKSRSPRILVYVVGDLYIVHMPLVLCYYKDAT